MRERETKTERDGHRGVGICFGSTATLMRASVSDALLFRSGGTRSTGGPRFAALTLLTSRVYGIRPTAKWACWLSYVPIGVFIPTFWPIKLFVANFFFLKILVASRLEKQPNGCLQIRMIENPQGQILCLCKSSKSERRRIDVFLFLLQPCRLFDRVLLRMATLDITKHIPCPFWQRARRVIITPTYSAGNHYKAVKAKYFVILMTCIALLSSKD